MLSVMIVDDEYLQRELVKASICWEELGMEVAGEACDGESAIKLFEESSPDIVIMDINIPFMNGIEVSEIIKNKAPEVQILILTAYGEFDYAKDALNLGAAAFILKPLDPRELLDKLVRAGNNILAARQKEVMPEFKSIGIPTAASGNRKAYEARKYIEQNYYLSDLSLNAVAEEIGVNSSYLSCLFKKEFQYSLSRYIIKIRLENAVTYMKETPDATLTEIAQEVGYTDVYYFSKSFKNYYGLSPSKYMDERSV